MAIILGSGLSGAVRARIDGCEIPFEKLGVPARALPGHPAVTYAGAWAGKRVVAFAGRAHLYQGYDANDVTYAVRLAAASGATTIVLTNAAGALNAAYLPGDVMLVTDHINLTGATPHEGTAFAPGDPFLNMVDAYAPHLRRLAREGAREATLHEGIYAGVRGPQYETPAESEAYRRLGADAIGMSTVLETIAARALRLDVLGLSLITNLMPSRPAFSHEGVLAASLAGAERVAAVIEEVLSAL